MNIKEQAMEDFYKELYISEQFDFGDFPPEDETHYENYKDREIQPNIKRGLNKAVDLAIRETRKEIIKELRTIIGGNLISKPEYTLQQLDKLINELQKHTGEIQ